MVINSTCLSFHWDFWLSEKIKNYFLSHLIPSSLEHHHGFEKWCSSQLFILIYCSDYFANNKGSVFSLQWPARRIKGENIHFNGRNLWDLLLWMARLIYTNDQMGRNSRDNFLLITNFKKYENYFYEKNLSWDPKTLKFEYEIFFLNFVKFIFVNTWIWKISRGLFSRICKIIAKISTAKISTIKVITFQNHVLWNCGLLCLFCKL